MKQTPRVSDHFGATLEKEGLVGRPEGADAGAPRRRGRVMRAVEYGGAVLRGFGDSLWYQIADTFQKSVLFVLALQMNSFLTELVDTGETNLYRLAVFGVFSVFSVLLMKLKATIEARFLLRERAENKGDARRRARSTDEEHAYLAAGHYLHTAGASAP